ncbi:MarR family winged helix-turn-helix transcriptional regulator [Rhodoplanes azumiensis]|uniref:MarR family winged helix-turn-helix transcriptional regulator n=1 Tax=Rhodoplanes azumiensis TaxID=1897628 RepID=A0ABW5AMC1_9BRAD
MTTEVSDSVAKLLTEWRRERPDLDPSPIGVQGRVMRLAAHFQRRTEDWLAPLGLSWEAFSLIVTLRRSGKPYELRPTDLLAESLLTSGAITNRIDKVEALGLVERRPDPRDRRGAIIRLTPAGKRLADRAIADHVAGVEGLLDALSGAEQRQLAALLTKLLVATERRVEGERHGRRRPAVDRPARTESARRKPVDTTRAD